MTDDEKKKEQDDDVIWSSLIHQLSNLARFCDPPIPIGFVIFLDIAICGFMAAAIGWFTALIFTEGRMGNDRITWLVIGYFFAAVIVFILALNRIYNHMSRIKLSGRDYQHVESKGDRGVSIFFSFTGSMAEIIACMMFTYSIVAISDNKIERQAADMTLQEINKVTAYKDSLAEKQTTYYRWLDADGDTTNDAWARKMLEKVETERAIARAIEDSIRQALTPVVSDTSTVLAASTGTILLKDITKEKKPENWKYKMSLALLSALIGLITGLGNSLCNKIIGRWKAFKNIELVYNTVNKVRQGVEDGLPNKFSRFIRTFGSVYGGKKSQSQREGGTKFNWESEAVKEKLGYIKANYREYGGNETLEQIGQIFDCGKSYLSQLVNAAIDAGQLPPKKK